MFHVQLQDMERAHTRSWYGSYTPKVVKLLGTHLDTRQANVQLICTNRD